MHQWRRRVVLQKLRAAEFGELLVSRLGNLWPFGSGYEVRTLNRDARYIIEDAEERFSDQRLSAMANLTRTCLSSANEQIGHDDMTIANVLPHFQDLHRTARKERQDMKLSALTLVIIYLRASKHHAACEPATTAIDAFLERWVGDDNRDVPAGTSGKLEA